MKKVITLLVIALIFIGGVVSYISYITSTVAVTIVSKNTKDITITTVIDSKTSTVARSTKDTTSLRLAKNRTYSVSYTGSEGYSDGQVLIPANGGVVTIDPDYSSERYATMMTEALPQTHTVLSQRYANLDSLYNVTAGSMKNKGEWFVVKLTFKGPYDYNSDMLRVLLQKKSDAWQLVTKPDILLTTTKYPAIDSAILSWANAVF